MASEAISGIGSQFLRKDPSSVGGLYAPIGEVMSISGPSRSRSVIDVTHFGSVDGYKEYITGLREAGELTFEMSFTDTSFLLLTGDFEDETRKNYRISLPPVIGKSLDFLGLVVAHGIQVSFDDKIMMPLTIRISGPVAYGVPTVAAVAPEVQRDLGIWGTDDDDFIFAKAA